MITKQTMFLTITAAIVLLIVLPPAGILMAGLPIGRYLEFPPHTHYVEHAGFAWPAFIGLGLLIAIAVIPFIIRILLSNRMTNTEPGAPLTRQPDTSLLTAGLLPPGTRRFPNWGWIGIAGGIVAWIMAWSRFEWFAPWQTFTFSPLWFGYIITVNALAYRRTGQCMLTHQPRFFFLLFPVSAAFWWLFEYLNRFVQNWYYVGTGSLTPWEYFLFATLPFSTVLPAVMGTFQLLAGYPRLYAGLTGFLSMPRVNARRVAAIVLAISAAGLAGIGLWPDYLFPLLWLAPLGVLASIQTLAGRTSLFADPARGDWRRIVVLALSALICGFFWEMWNFYSATKWIYAVPFVNRFHIFEMPVLGYTGYLPFGLECAIIADSVAHACKRRNDNPL